MSNRVVVIGAGVFGCTAALSLRSRGHSVTLLEAGEVPNELAASTDISKVMRMEYGSDESYMQLGEASREGWLRWNHDWASEGLEPLYHETGVLMVCRAPMQPGGFEHDSWTLLNKRGHTPERLEGDAVAERYPAWRPGAYVDGFLHAEGGYVESGHVVRRLAATARQRGVRIVESVRIERIEDRAKGHRVVASGAPPFDCDIAVVAAGAWTPKLVPELVEALRPTGHPVFHLRPTKPALFEARVFPTFTADVARTGYYGFPLSRAGVVKIGVHSLGVPIDADAPRRLPADAVPRLRAFLSYTFPALADAPVVYTRLCPYIDSQDEDFWICSSPERPGLVIASGGSGHGFKFAPVLGDLIADAVEGADNPMLEKFRWRPDLRMDRGREAARFHGVST